MFNNKPKKYFIIISLTLGFFYYIGLETSKVQLKAQPVPQNQEETLKENSEAQENPENQANQEQNSTQEKPAEKDVVTTIKSLFEAGGPFMWPLLIASIIGFAISFERLFYFSFHKFTKKSFEQDIKDLLEADGLKGVYSYIEKYQQFLISKILKEGLEVSNQNPDNFIKGVEREANIYFALAERGLPVLAAISTIAPLIGFLGTVSGMIGAFDAIATADTVNAKIVAAGIKEALITTAAGLIVAVPVMAFFQYFQNKVNNFSAEIETIANHIYKELLRISSSAPQDTSATVSTHNA